MWQWLDRLCHFSYDKMQSHYPNGTFTGIGKAAGQLSLLNDNNDKKPQEQEDESDVDE
jgi:hypothetical protein